MANPLTALLAALTTPLLTRAAPSVVVPSAPEDAPRAPIRETGYVVPAGATDTPGAISWWSDPLASEDGPDLAWPQSVRTFDRMRRSDSQVGSVLRAVTLPVRRTDWSLDPAGADDAVVQLCAEDLGLPVLGWGDDKLPARRSRDRFSFAEHLTEALRCLIFGHAYFEQIYRIDQDGYARLRKLAPRPATTISNISVATDGGLVAITQEAASGRPDDAPRIPVSRLVAYIHGGGAGDWRGESILRSAYKDWLLKDQLLRIDTETIARNGMGVPTYTASEEGGQAEISEGRKLAQAYRASGAGGASLPHGATLTLTGVQGDLPAALPRIQYHDEQIGRAVLAHFLNLNAQGGSYALAAVQADTFVQSLQTLAQSLADVLTQHVVEDLVDLNFGVSARAPRVVFADIGSQQAATAQAIALLVDKKILTPDDELEQAVRRTYRLPNRPDTAEPTPRVTPEDTGQDPSTEPTTQPQQE